MYICNTLCKIGTKKNLRLVTTKRTRTNIIHSLFLELIDNDHRPPTHCPLFRRCDSKFVCIELLIGGYSLSTCWHMQAQLWTKKYWCALCTSTKHHSCTTGEKGQNHETSSHKWVNSLWAFNRVCGNTEERTYDVFCSKITETKHSTKHRILSEINAPVFCSSSALIVAPGPMDSDWAPTKW